MGHQLLKLNNIPAYRPAEVQVLPERVKHITYNPPNPEPLYKHSKFSPKSDTCFIGSLLCNSTINTFVSSVDGMEKQPMSRSAMGEGRIVYEYEPVIGSFVSCLSFLIVFIAQ